MFAQGTQYFLKIQLFFEEVLLNLNKAGKYSRELATTARMMPAVRECMEGKTTWPRNLKATTKKMSNQY